MASRPMWRRQVATTTTPVAIYIPNGLAELKVYCVEAHLVGFGVDYAAPSTTLADHVFTVETIGGPTGGTFTLKFDGQETGTVIFNSSFPGIVTALNALSNVNSGDFVGAGGPLPTPVTLTAGQVYDATDLSGLLIPGSSSLTGGVNANVQVRSTTVGGVSPYVFAEAGYTELLPVGDLTRTRVQAARYVYLAAVAATGTVRLSGYRG